MALDFTVLDFETCNLRHPAAGTQVGLVRVRNGHVADSMVTLLKPYPGHDYFDPKAVAINNIPEQKVIDAPMWAQVHNQVMSFIGNDVVFAHNAPFDAERLTGSAYAGLGVTPSIRFACTWKLGERLVRDTKNFKLPTLTKYFGIPHDNAHDALSDCLAVAALVVRYASIVGANDIATLFKRTGYSPFLSSHCIHEEDAVLREMDAAVVQAASKYVRPVESLAGQVVSFTGWAGLPRELLFQAARSAGAKTLKRFGKTTTVLVTGRCSPHGRLRSNPIPLEVKKAIEANQNGRNVAIMWESQFRQLAGPFIPPQPPIIIPQSGPLNFPLQPMWKAAGVKPAKQHGGCLKQVVIGLGILFLIGSCQRALGQPQKASSAETRPAITIVQNQNDRGLGS